MTPRKTPVLHRAAAFCMAALVTLVVLTGIDSLAVSEHATSDLMAAVSASTRA